MKIFLTFFLLFSLASAHAGSLRTIIIDPGHGGHDIGGHTGKVYEKWLTLDTSLRLERILKERGYRTVLTRRSDVFISLSQRAAIANKYSNAAFVSIHFNHAGRAGACGFETFYHNAGSKALASYVQHGMLSHLKATNRGVKYARFYVIRNNKIPSILVEGGFVSNRAECNRIKEAWFREGLAKGIADGISRYNSAR